MIRIFFLLPAAMLALAMLHMPYGYYQLLKLAVTACAAFLAYGAWRHSAWLTVAVFGLVALLYNPLRPVAFARDEWFWINGATIAIFVGAMVIYSIAGRTLRATFGNEPGSDYPATQGILPRN